MASRLAHMPGIYGYMANKCWGYGWAVSLEMGFTFMI
jgi:hypothetical protein